MTLPAATTKPYLANTTTPNSCTRKHNAPLLYLLTNDDDFDVLYQKLELVLATGIVSLLQIRRKRVLNQVDGRDTLYKESQKLIGLAQYYAVAVVMNDDVELAQQLGIGVHLGQDDGSVVQARQALGRQALIGRTCHQSVELVQVARQEGASYAAMGAVFTSSTKPDANVVSLDQLSKGCAEDIDVCAIGGITAENAQALRGLDIKYIAVVGDILNYPVSQIEQRCQSWQKVLQDWPQFANRKTNRKVDRSE